MRMLLNLLRLTDIGAIHRLIIAKSLDRLSTRDGLSSSRFVEKEHPLAGSAGVNLNRLAVFVSVVETGSLTAAAAKLGLTKTMVSTHIQRLEAEVGASLLIRTTRRLNLTDAGEAFFDASRRIVHDADVAISIAGQDGHEPRGTLTVTAPVDYGASVIGPVAASLSIKYPKLRIDLMTIDRLVDIVSEGMDVAVRLGRLADSSHHATRIGGFADWLVASPAYLGKRGPPGHPDDLIDHRFIALSVLSHPAARVFEGPDKAKHSVKWDAVLSANTATAVREIAVAGGGLAILPDFAVAGHVASGRLVRILPRWRLPSGGIYAVFPSARQQPRKVRVFIDAMREHVKNQQEISEAF